METIMKAYRRIEESVLESPCINFSQIDEKRSVLIITDMINGFAHEGALASPRVKGIIDPIVKLAKELQSRGIPIIAFADAHPEQAVEFESYAPHCILGTTESAIVPEIEKEINYKRMNKNSTNGYLEPEFQLFLMENPLINQFVIVGNCTDICIQQLAITLKTHFNRLNQKVDVIVPINALETYDYDLHQGDLMHTMGLYMMKQNGVRIVKAIVQDCEAKA
jgi:nicotinamidase-related amidase